jgi:hypothetical protein
MPEAKPKDDCDFDEPWPLYADEDEPWKDYERLLKLDAKFTYQYEVADALGTSPSTISYWLGKAKDEYQPEPDDERLKCDRFEACGNQTPGPNNGLCDVCLDLARHNTMMDDKYKTKGLDATDFESMLAYQRALYEEYPDYAAERQEAYDRQQGNLEDEDDSNPECDECGKEMKFADGLDSYICTNCTATTEP